MTSDTNSVQKPGPSIHSAKWDACVAQVGTKNPTADPYAVCTAQLGEESFKSEYRDLAYTKSMVAQARKAVGTAFGGKIPNSLLANQDLEPSACGNCGKCPNCETLDKASMPCPECGLERGCNHAKKGVDFGHWQANKSANTATNDTLRDLAQDAEYADTKGEKEDIKDDIVTAQKKRQKAAIRERKAYKSFGAFWADQGK